LKFDVADTLYDLLLSYWPTVAGALGVLASILASGHAVLHKRDSRAVAGWFALAWLAPVVGPGLYVLVGVNRIRRRARAVRTGMGDRVEPALPEEPLARALADDEHLRALAHFTNRVIGEPLLAGNQVDPLEGGALAFAALLKAIDGAKRSLTLSTYIFDPDEVGLEFIDALVGATERGVEVRVLIDGVGVRYAWPRSASRTLRKRGVPVAKFLPTRVPWRFTYTQLRLHKKSLIVDGRDAFCGGMNVRVGHALARKPKHPVLDVQFSITGPVVAQLQKSFAEDWEFTTQEELKGELWFPTLDATGPVLARAVNDGPDEDFEKLRWTFHAGLACAARSVRIVTPYFLPDRPLITALASASMRGVDVEIVLPAECNLSLPEWASRGQMWQVLVPGCRVFLSPPPFDHSKLMVVDDRWVLIGSGNWDPRSYRLCFELNVECYDEPLATRVNALIDERREKASELTLEQLGARPFLVKLRDGAARILSPYL
jgi:cardiolipin synthase